MGPWKRRCAWKAQGAFHFSTATTTEIEQRSTKVCGGEKETKEQSNGVSENLVALMRP
jgi:hypothetical protein